MFCCSTKKKKPAMRPQIEVHTSNQSTNNTMNLSTDRSNNFNEEIKRFIKNKGDKTIDDERQLIKKLVQLSDQTHLINQIWSMKYTEYLQNNGPKPGPIDNKELIQKLKDNVAEEGRDYDCIPELVWNFVVEIYTGGPVVLKPEEQLIQSLRVFPSPSLHSIKDSYTNFKELKSQDLQIVGLRNQKYFCYLNSLLQCWMGIGVMNNYIFNLPITESQQYLWSFLTLIQKVQQTQFAHSISASKLIQLLTKTFSGYQMHDSQEVMLFLLEKFKSEMQKKAYIRDQAPSQAQESYIQYCRNNNNFVDELFFGQLTSSIQCKYCNSESNQHDPFYDMSLPVDGKTFMSQTITLNDCLKLFFKDDIIETWNCGQCNKKNNKIKRKTKISHTPNILILHLKRFRQYPQKMKVNEPVTIQQELDIQSYCLQDVKDTKYKLIAMILHSGSIDQGHYVAVVNRKDKNQKESFYLFDDEEVQILHQSCLNKIDSVYILFYHKV